MKSNIFTNDEWEHIEKHNTHKNIKDLIKSLKDNDCNLCRSFWLRLFAIHKGFLVQSNGSYYVLNKEVAKEMQE
jgi:hypothetical protein